VWLINFVFSVIIALITSSDQSVDPAS